ncbi:hypothetical protein FRC03_006087 [Tulasnella sp. 419]|nr:hypothetical protein FRC03_006087 [Tulasnella sp. 419]
MSNYVARRLGVATPRYPVKNFGTYSSISSSVPDGCSVTLVSTLQRHGARNPTSRELNLIVQTLNKIKSIASHRPPVDPSFAFISSYDIRFGAESLVPFGRKQTYLIGQLIATTYPNLARSGVFIRSITRDRVAESSRWFKQGFNAQPFAVKKTTLVDPDQLLAIGPGLNNTLSVTTCHEAKLTRPELQWLSVYGPPIAERLNIALGLNPEDSGQNLSPARLNSLDVMVLMTLCGYEAARDNGEKGPWCDVFSKEEWEANEYFHDLKKYYRYGPGSLVSRTQGSGWVNELVARLTSTPVRYAGAINFTLDSNPETFPLPPKSPKIFADFTSDNDIYRIFSALGILREDNHLNPNGPPPKDRFFNIAKMAPFAGTFVVEKLTCSAHPHSIPKRGQVPLNASVGNRDYVRMILNDAVVPLSWKECGDLGLEMGLCEMDAFLETQKFSLSGGEWDRWCAESGQDAG